MPSKTLDGTNPDGTPHFHVDLSDHPGMQDPDVTKHTHLIVMTPVPLNGEVSVTDGTQYDLSETWQAVPLEHVDELAILIHEATRAAGFTTDPAPTVGPLQAARDAFVAAGTAET